MVAQNDLRSYFTARQPGRMNVGIPQTSQKLCFLEFGEHITVGILSLCNTSRETCISYDHRGVDTGGSGCMKMGCSCIGEQATENNGEVDGIRCIIVIAYNHAFSG